MRSLVVLVVLVVAARVSAEPLPDRTDRVVGLARVWAKVKLYHPYLAYKDIDWDAALVAAIPRAEAATTPADYRAAVQGMLAVLADPVTRVVDPSPAPPKPPADWLTKPAPGIVEVNIAAFVGPDGSTYREMARKAEQLEHELETARVLLVDMRGAPVDDAADAFSQLDALLPAIDEWPLQRTIEHHGYRSQAGQTSGGYFSTFITPVSQPAKPGPKHALGHVVVLLDADSAVPVEALALQARGRATLVAHGVLAEDGIVSTTKVELPGKLAIKVRLGELLWGSPVADVSVAKAADVEARGLAIARSAAPHAEKAHKVTALPALRVKNDLDYADTPYPSRERRMLAGIRMWAVIDNLYPYRDLIADWDGALREALPKLADAPDRASYRRVLTALSVRIGDGHVGIASADDKPSGATAISTRLVEGKLAIVGLVVPAEATKLGLAIGDAIETIDGKPAAEAVATRKAETTGSTDEARTQGAAQRVLFGDVDTAVKLGVRDVANKLREVTLTRTAANLAALRAPASTPHWRQLANGIGYADLRSLVVSEVGPMFDAFKGTRAIIFDMRGYPNGTAWSIAPRINTKHARYGAQGLMPLGVGADDELVDLRVRALQKLPELPAGASIYAGKIVVLVDDRAISQAEHTCLFFEMAAGATFVGSPTAGTNGDVTRMLLPGGLRMSFTGLEVRHVDGRPLQKVGIQPDILVRPTLAGLRAGKDEVLERAIASLH